jgi:hypothetical protein
MNPNDVPVIREAVIKAFKDHPTLMALPLSHLPRYVDCGDIPVHHLNDVILHRDDFVDNQRDQMGNTKKLPEIFITPEVLDAINDELAYQTTLAGSGRADAEDHGVAGQLVTLKVYTDEALIAWTKNPGDEAALNALRKVAAIAIRALVQYGCPKRIAGITRNGGM